MAAATIPDKVTHVQNKLVLASPDVGVSKTAARRISVFVAVSYFLGAIIAGTLLYSSYFHLKNPYAFLVSITKYGLVGPKVGALLAIALPWWQLALGLALILRHWPRVTALMSALLLSAFTVAQTSAVTRGLEIGCGCFGVVGEEKITTFTASRIGIFCALAWVMFALEAWCYSRCAVALRSEKK